LAKALARLAGARLSLGNKLLYLGFLIAMAAGAYGRAKTRAWINHRSFRPARLGTFLEWLKGDDFYGWMRARPRPRKSAPAIELDKTVPFGRIGAARQYQWYGWTRLALYDDWCVGAEAALVFAAPETKETLVFEAQIRPALVGAVKRQHLKVLANDLPVHEKAITTKTMLRFQVPADAWRGRSEIVLRFQTPSFLVPRFIFEAGEGIRAQSIAFTWMRWSILSDPKQKAPSAPYLPVGVWIDTTEHNSPHLAEGWRRTADGLVRMERRTARLLASVLEPAAGDHVLSLEFEKEKSLQRSPLAVVTGAMVQSQLDLAQQSRLDLVLRRGYIPATGALAVDFHSNAIVGPAVRQLDGEGPAGPALCRMRLLQIDGVAKRAVFQPGQTLDFRAGGTGAAYLGVGWHRPEEIGTLSSDVVAELNGLWIDRDSEIFITALLQPGATDGPLSTAVVRVRAGDVLLARYVIDGPSELTAIVPASLVGEDRLLTLKFETDALLRPSDFGDVSESRAVGVVLRSLVLS
jgi:hypothetical protein